MYLEVHDPENPEDIRKSVQIILDAVKTLPKKHQCKNTLMSIWDVLMCELDKTPYDLQTPGTGTVVLDGKKISENMALFIENEKSRPLDSGDLK